MTICPLCVCVRVFACVPRLEIGIIFCDCFLHILFYELLLVSVYVFACVHVRVCVPECRCGVRSSGGGVSSGYELSAVDAVNPILGPLEEQHGLLTVEPSLQPPPNLLRQSLSLKPKACPLGLSQ